MSTHILTIPIHTWLLMNITEYTYIKNSYPYMALNEHNYIPLTETQLGMCDKMGSTYYCENSYVFRLRGDIPQSCF